MAFVALRRTRQRSAGGTSAGRSPSAEWAGRGMRHDSSQRDGICLAWRTLPACGLGRLSRRPFRRRAVRGAPQMIHSTLNTSARRVPPRLTHTWRERVPEGLVRSRPVHGFNAQNLVSGNSLPARHRRGARQTHDDGPFQPSPPSCLRKRVNLSATASSEAFCLTPWASHCSSSHFGMSVVPALTGWGVGAG